MSPDVRQGCICLCTINPATRFDNFSLKRAGFRAALAALVDLLSRSEEGGQGRSELFWFAEFIGAQRRPFTASAAEARYAVCFGSVPGWKLFELADSSD